jgi:YidC/Oxa1 family membrane protein insertase
VEGTAINELRSLFDVFKPLHAVWWLVFGQTITAGLHAIYVAVAAVPFFNAIGAYGLAIVILTVVIKLVLWPLYQLQLSLSRKSMLEQRKIAPELAALRKKHKGDPQKQQEEMMKLYKEHGVNPLGPLMGCLPALVQFPILTALYWVFLGNAHSDAFPAHFLFVPNLNDSPSAHPLLPGLPIPTLVYLVFPLLAAATTFVQSKMIQQPPNPYATEQEQQTQQMTQSMQVMMPLMIAVFAISTPAGLGLYWFVSNCVAIIQQYFVTGWGALRPANGPPTPPPPPASGSGNGRSVRKPRRPRR